MSTPKPLVLDPMPHHCRKPGPRKKYSTSLWACPDCGQAWQATRQQPHNMAPEGLSWYWARWPREAGGPRLEDQG